MWLISFWSLPGGTEKNLEKVENIASIRGQIWATDLPNTKKERGSLLQLYYSSLCDFPCWQKLAYGFTL
jgi:hypothetical protein